ncbi:ATP-grasp domain-containing protein [Streptomyces sp. NBC_00006]|uniref:ATP-grasp domain-containing protein n=1 Tax=Streptomyces sp. NBC_00006 TaxID=2975619 RepID=UPI00225095C6|nr:ATP-grasp domain-containing protein [Streptomyces sp. NBC_00006]MCX5533474.1 ATP-grasp domain-containing protein [Streptomyces sp. NBC_00006]
MRLMLIGYNDGVLAALDESRPAGSVVLVEEADLWEAKGLAARAAAHPCLGEVRFGRYQQDEQFLDVVRDFGPVDAVVAGLEYAVVAAARAAEELGLPGPGAKAAAVLRDKLLLRETMRAAGLPTPAFREVGSAEDIAAFAAGGPCVVKPAGRQASLGVLLLDAGADPGAAWRHCTGADEGRQLAKRPMTWRYLAEERLYGPEFSTEGLVDEGRVVFCNATRKYTLEGPSPVETGHTVHAQDPSWTRELQAFVDAIGYGSGILHAEWVRTADGPRLIECAGRPPGDRIMDLIDLAYDVDLHGRWIATLLGEDTGPAPTPVRAAAIRFLTAPRPGTITGIDGADAVRARPGVVRVDLTRKPGDTVTDVRSSWDRLGSVITTGVDAPAAERAAREAADLITVSLNTAPETNSHDR